MVGFPGILLLSAALTSGAGGDSTAQEKSWADSLKPLAEAILERGDAFLPEGLQRQRAIRRVFQRRGYTNVLFQVLSEDVPGAVMAFIKMNIWLVYSTPHHVYMLIPPDPDHGIPGIPFPDDASYPPNPWKEKYPAKKEPDGR
jgi:hypothetical protein